MLKNMSVRNQWPKGKFASKSNSEKHVWQYIHCVLAKVLDCDLEVGEFELQSRNYVHFRTNILRNSIELLFDLTLGEIISLLLFYMMV